jgi:hypothetical protein
VTRAPFAIRAEDALKWHPVSQEIAGIAERAGFRIRARDRRWEVWSTDDDLAALKTQEFAP